MQGQNTTKANQLKTVWGSFARDWFYLWRSLLVIAGLIAVLSGTVFSVRTYDQFATENRSRIAEYESLAPYFSNYLMVFDFDSITNLSMAVLGNGTVLSVTVLDRRGYVVFNTERGKNTGDDIKIFKAPLTMENDAKTLLGHLEISYAAKSPREIFFETLQVAVETFILAFLASCALITFFVRRYVMAPIDDLTCAVQKTLSTGEPVKAAFGTTSPFQNFLCIFNDMQERLERVQTGLSQSLEAVEHERKLNAELGNVLQKVLAAIGQNVSHFSADGQVRTHDIGRPGLSIFKNLPPPYPNTAPGLKEALLLQAGGKEKRQITILDQPETQNIIFEMEIQDKANTVHSVKCIDLGDGTRAVITTDITESREIEKSLRQKHKLEALGALTSGVAHDFNNLLAVISGALEILLTRGTFVEVDRNFLNQILYATERATAVVNGLLVYSHQKPVSMATVRVKDVFDRLVNILPATLGPAIAIEKNITQHAYISVDESLLESALLNLIVNARDAMDGAGTLGLNAGRAPPQFVQKLNLAKDKEYCMIEVTDTGPGIDEAMLHRITDPFFTSKEIGKGTGLGLSTVVGFAEQMGGKLHFENKREGGAKFAIVLPEMPEPIGQAHAPLIAPSSVSKRVPKRLLIVDDEVALCEIWAMAARNAGIFVDTAASAQEAKTVYFTKGNTGYDVMVTDLNMPDGNGLELAKAIRAYDKNVVIIATSGNAGLMTDQGEFQEYFDGMYTKPIKLGKLVDLISEHWQAKQNPASVKKAKRRSMSQTH